MTDATTPGCVVTCGHGTVTLVPDVATVRFGTEAEGASVVAAMAAGRTGADGVLAAVAAAGVARAAVRTEHAGVYEHHDRQGRRVGYRASVSYTVRVEPPERAESVIGAAAEAAGNAFRLDGVTFGVRDGGAARADARRLAVLEAREAAEALAEAAGVRLGAVTAIEELAGAEPGGARLALSASMAHAESGPAIEAGTQSVTVSVRLAVAIVS